VKVVPLKYVAPVPIDKITSGWGVAKLGITGGFMLVPTIRLAT
jgi:hypothetical protein